MGSGVQESGFRHAELSRCTMPYHMAKSVAARIAMLPDPNCCIQRGLQMLHEMPNLPSLDVRLLTPDF